MGHHYNIEIPKEVETAIVNDLTNSRLSSFQVAVKYKLRPQSISRIGVKYIGKENFLKREQILNKELNEEFHKLLDEGMSATAIADKLGLNVCTCYKVIAGKLFLDKSAVSTCTDKESEVQVIRFDDEQNTQDIKPVPMNSAAELPAVDMKSVLEEQPQQQRESTSQNEQKVQEQSQSTHLDNDYKPQSRALRLQKYQNFKNYNSLNKNKVEKPADATPNKITVSLNGTEITYYTSLPVEQSLAELLKHMQ